MLWIELDDDGVVIAERIVAVGQAESAPMRRLLDIVPPEKVIVLTGGRRRQAIVILDSDHVVVSALSVAELLARLKTTR